MDKNITITYSVWRNEHYAKSFHSIVKVNSKIVWRIGRSRKTASNALKHARNEAESLFARYSNMSYFETVKIEHS